MSGLKTLNNFTFTFNTLEIKEVRRFGDFISISKKQPYFK
jgi:hypothetical protein